MATLVLTAVGTALGGPIGAAIGAIAGQAIDRNILFKPKGRQGPRLTELAVQTSSYGTPIPQLFGTMRVAGTVIWSTDLIETKAKSSGGKGQPSVTNFSYSASFAVLLSARRIAGVGRIWADGKLLRGSGGDFKTATGFRIHHGDEAQPPDPLIASAEGVAMAPAHRGQSYVVFEQFQLADYGNRIPSLTFEVIADAAPVPIGAIAEVVSGGVVVGDAVTMPLHGFSAYGDSIRGVLETLAVAGGAWFAPDGTRLLMRDAATDPVAIEDEGAAGERSRGGRRVRSLATIETVPLTVTVAHYDPARDYQTGLQRARRPGAGARSDRIELPAAIDAGGAKAIAERALGQAEAAREQRQVTLGWGSLAIAPGDCVTIMGTPGAGSGGDWRVRDWSLEAMVLTLNLQRLGGGANGVATASSGRVLANPDDVHGPTILQVFELPSLDDQLLTMPRLLVAAAGTSPGWRRAALLVSNDGGARFASAGGTAIPAVMGVVASTISAAPATLRDLTGTIDVTLAHAQMALTGADDAAIDSGANLALLGDELIQFGEAEQIGARQWRLGRLLRGRRGTEAAAGTQAIGDRFVLIERESLAAIKLPVSAIGSAVRVLASGVGDTAGPVSVDTMPGGASVRPPSPVHLALRSGSTGAPELRWVRRSRAGWRWIDGTDAPLGEEREAYSVTIAPVAGPSRTIQTTANLCAITANEAIGGTVITVRQRGSSGDSPPASITLV